MPFSDVIPFQDFNNLIPATCVDFIRNDISGLLVALDRLWTSIITICFAATSFIRYQLILFLVSIALFLNSIITWAFQQLFQQAGCDGGYQLPSFQTSHLTLIMWLFFLFLVFCSKVYPNVWFTIMIVLAEFVILFARVYITLNTPTQMYSGVLLGMVQSILYFLAICAVMDYYHKMKDRTKDTFIWICNKFKVVDTVSLFTYKE